MHSPHVPSVCPDLNFILCVACYKLPSLCGCPNICTNLSLVSAIYWHSANSPHSHSHDRRSLLLSPLYTQANCSPRKLGTCLKLRFLTTRRLSWDANPHLILKPVLLMMTIKGRIVYFRKEGHFTHTLQKAFATPHGGIWNTDQKKVLTRREAIGKSVTQDLRCTWARHWEEGQARGGGRGEREGG